ncbi:hypothetical protein I3F58_02325 [Streptomyces sp. MUM 203J]|uniref:hypothetical protein n=1 Tax=Streptomyces sp. MUM 203J TaxID=2791990 RepID=UPI001F038E2A|nr:hypothetical protein [Streptomyces sp. MUM 203J]MCH0538414.1 hypothetical protein [Streptomyces sp. MUM 203J]
MRTTSTSGTFRHRLGRRRSGRPAAAASLLLAAALGLTGCSGSSDGKEADASPSASGPALSAAERLEQEQDATQDEETPKAAEPTGPTVPEGDLKPATGSFSKPEKEFLTGRVPESMEPAAVLDVGKESCQRIERTAKRDKTAAAAAVAAGEIPDAEAAVAHLCPEQRPVVDAAKGGYGDGTHEKPAAGSYKTVSSGPSCSWQVTDAKGNLLASGPDAGATGPHSLKIPSGAARFVSSGCYAWLRA